MELQNKAESCNNITVLRSYADQANAVKLRLLNQMDRMDAELARKAAEKPTGANTVKETRIPYKVKTKKKKNVAIKTVTQT